MICGYDSQTGHLFEYTDDIHYVGRESRLEAPPCSPEEAMVLAAQLTCGFLGWISIFLPDGRLFASRFFKRTHFFCEIQEAPNALEHIAFVDRPIPKVLDQFHTAKTYALALGDAAVALGYLFKNLLEKGENVTPRRLWFLEPFPGDKSGEEFQENLEGDAVGKMARYCSLGVPVVNERYTSLRDDGFFDRIFVAEKPDCSCVYLISPVGVDSLFPGLSASWRYACGCCPVEVSSTDQFKKYVKDDSEKVTIRIVSSLDHNDAWDFIRFWQVLSNRRVAISCKKDVAQQYNKVAVFRYDRWYMQKRGGSDEE